MKNNALKIAALGFMCALLAAAIYVFRPVDDRLTRVTVVGESEAKISPDTAVITFAVITQGKQAVYAQQENARRSEAVRRAVEAITADANPEIKTSNYQLRPEQDHYSGKMPRILGYEVRNTVTVSIDKLDRVGEIIDAATAAGANSVLGIEFVVGQSSPAQGEALALASKQAMAKAEAAAAAINGKIVRIVQSTEGGVDPRHVEASYAYAASNTISYGVSSRRLAITPIETGDLKFRSQVVLIVDIQTREELAGSSEFRDP